MITLYDGEGASRPVDVHADSVPPGVIVIDLLRAEPAEVEFVERVSGVRLPTPHRLSEVETSSRLAMQDDAILVTTPVVYRDEDGSVDNTPVGFVLTGSLLITIRMMQLKSFADVLGKPFRLKDASQGYFEVFLSLLEVMVDRMADAMEQVGADLDSMSERIFEPERSGYVSLKPTRVERRLARTLKGIGRSGSLTSHARNSLLGLGRLVAYVGTHAADRLYADSKSRLTTLREDIASLNEFETRLTDKVQFLLDFDAGFHQHRAEPHVQDPDGRIRDRHPADLRGRPLRHEFQEHAGI